MRGSKRGRGSGAPGSFHWGVRSPPWPRVDYILLRPGGCEVSRAAIRVGSGSAESSPSEPLRGGRGLEPERGEKKKMPALSGRAPNTRARGRARPSPTTPSLVFPVFSDRRSTDSPPLELRTRIMIKLPPQPAERGIWSFHAPAPCPRRRPWRKRLAWTRSTQGHGRRRRDK